MPIWPKGAETLKVSRRIEQVLELLRQLLAALYFIWSYVEHDPKIPIPAALDAIANAYDFIRHTADQSIETDLLTMLLNMHDYNKTYLKFSKELS
ncbi:MAG: hypothetical protein ACFB5Z_06485 [Elainellaceae cyanobacterium]